MTDVDICNQALVSMGMQPITSLEINDNSAIRCRIAFPICRDRMLREHNWSFAIRSVKLQQLATYSPQCDYPVVAALPAGCIKVIRLQSRNPYLLRGGNILLHSLPETLDYVAAVENAELFDPAFADALASLIASVLALYSTRDAGILQYHQNEYRRKIAIARSVDSIENIHDAQSGKFRSKFIEARG